jgi:hypothetical protein
LSTWLQRKQQVMSKAVSQMYLDGTDGFCGKAIMLRLSFLQVMKSGSQGLNGEM